MVYKGPSYFPNELIVRVLFKLQTTRQAMAEMQTDRFSRLWSQAGSVLPLSPASTYIFFFGGGYLPASSRVDKKQEEKNAQGDSDKTVT